MNQGTKLGSQIGRWIILAALVVALGALLLTMQPVGAQQTQTTHGCDKVGVGADREYVCNFTFAENGTGPVHTLGPIDRDQRQVVKVWELVTNANDPAVASQTELDGFGDYSRFKIDRKTGDLSFRSPPDYENPGSLVNTTGDLATRNVYKVKAKVGDGHRYRPAEITVRVTGVEEAETVTLSARQPQAGVKLTATLTGGDIRGLRTPDWRWQVQDGTGWVNIPQAVNSSYTPGSGDVGEETAGPRVLRGLPREGGYLYYKILRQHHIGRQMYRAIAGRHRDYRISRAGRTRHERCPRVPGR